VKAWVSKVTRGAIVATAISATVLIVASSRDGPGSDLASPMRSVAPGLVSLDAPEGGRLLFESEAHAAFFSLISHFETQKSQTYCGLAAIAMVLNALEVPAPTTAYGSYRLFTQENVLNRLTDSIINDRTVARRGMSLNNVAEVLGVYGVSVDIHYADASGIDVFRRLAVDYLSKPGGHVIVNYSRSALGQEGRGHISPLGAYDADSDRFLILDVARYKAPAVWVSTKQLFNAMAELKGSRKVMTRGFLLIRTPLATPS
jgi:Phytochelatin synthase